MLWFATAPNLPVYKKMLWLFVHSHPPLQPPPTPHPKNVRNLLMSLNTGSSKEKEKRLIKL